LCHVEKAKRSVAIVTPIFPIDSVKRLIPVPISNYPLSEIFGDVIVN
jgi:hypothetical protein